MTGSKSNSLTKDRLQLLYMPQDSSVTLIPIYKENSSSLPQLSEGKRLEKSNSYVNTHNQFDENYPVANLNHPYLM